MGCTVWSKWSRTTSVGTVAMFRMCGGPHGVFFARIIHDPAKNRLVTEVVRHRGTRVVASTTSRNLAAAKAWAMPQLQRFSGTTSTKKPSGLRGCGCGR